MSTWFKLILIAGLFVTEAAFAQQVTPRVAGLENNYRYLDLLKEEQQLHLQEDSITRIIGQTREKLAVEENGQQKYGAVILNLEEELFDVRNRIGMVTGDINRIEQEFVIRNFRDQAEQGPAEITPTPKAQGEGVRNLIYNSHFKIHLPAEDYKVLKQAQRMESVIPDLLTGYTTNYNTLKTLAASYQAAPGFKEAEPIYQKYRTLTALNNLLADSLAQTWEYVYDNKSYAYSYLLDKMNRTDLLADFERRFADLRQKEAQLKDAGVASDVVAAYPLRQRYLLSYEQKLSEVLGYSLALDSINKAIAAISAVQYDLSAIALEERVFIAYAPISITTPSVYNNKNPIPLNIVYSKGTVYKIQLGTFSTRPSLATFRGVSPLSYEQLPDQRYWYYAGAFAERAEADEALALLKRAGFRRPEVVVWTDGRYENLTTPETTASEAGGLLFRVVITGQGDTLSDDLRALIQSHAPSKEVARTEEADQTYLYTVGTFDNRIQAEQLAEALVASDATAEVQELRPE